MPLPLRHFVTESFGISGVHSPESLLSDVEAHAKFAKIGMMSIEDICGFARAIDPKADYVKSPAHTEAITERVLTPLNVALAAAAEKDRAAGAGKPVLTVLARPGVVKKEQRDWIAYLTYRAFMEVSPFLVEPMNGIVGRALWLWAMGGEIEKLFSHTFHDQALRFGGVAEVQKEKIT